MTIPDLTSQNLQNILVIKSIIQLCISLSSHVRILQECTEIVSAMEVILNNNFPEQIITNCLYVISSILRDSASFCDNFASNNEKIEFFISLLHNDNNQIVDYALLIIKYICISDQCKFDFHLDQFSFLLTNDDHNVQRDLSLCIGAVLINSRLIFMKDQDISNLFAEVFNFLQECNYICKVQIMKSIRYLLDNGTNAQILQWMNSGLQQFLPLFIELDHDNESLVFLQIMIKILQTVENLELEQSLEFLRYLEEIELPEKLDELMESSNNAVLTKTEIVLGQIHNIEMRQEAAEKGLAL